MSQRLLFTGLSCTALLALSTAAATAQTFTSDVKIQGSLCVGVDCTSTESFGFDTIRLKENNLRIKFQDTSSSASFPSNDWQITANDSSNGGAEKFSVDDVDSGRTPFTIEAGAPSNAVYIDTDSKVGFNTSNPVVDLHVVEGNSPTLRLEQDGSSGFTPQTWDISGNEANFFIRDVTGSSKLPFRIKPGAPDDGIFMAASGNIGLGTDSPGAALHLDRNAANTEFRIEADGGAFMTFVDRTNNDNWYFTKQNANDGRFELTSQLDGTVNTATGTINLAMFLEPDGDMTIDGTLTENSDKHAKMAIEPVDPAEVLAKLATLEVARWTYKDDTSGARHMGPMAQDFYAAFGLGTTDKGISTLDTSGVAIAAIQALQAENAALLARIETLEAVLAD